MLKIKDDVDLKELEKFGFELNEYINDLNIKDWGKIKYFQDKDGNILDEVPPLDRSEINWATYDKGEYPNKTLSICVFDTPDNDVEKMGEREILDEDVDLDTLYDLIKADLVEKVEENK